MLASQPDQLARRFHEWRLKSKIPGALLTPPFSAYEDYINVHRVDVVSAESGASYDCIDECRLRDTAFGTIFPIEVVNRLSGSDYNARAVFQLEQWEVFRAASVVPFDAIQVISNTERYGGMAIHVATVTTPPTGRLRGARGAGGPSCGSSWCASASRRRRRSCALRR